MKCTLNKVVASIPDDQCEIELTFYRNAGQITTFRILVWMANYCQFVCKVGISENFSLFVKFIYSEEATKFRQISTLLLSYAMPVKSKVEILQIFLPG